MHPEVRRRGVGGAGALVTSAASLSRLPGSVAGTGRQRDGRRVPACCQGFSSASNGYNGTGRRMPAIGTAPTSPRMATSRFTTWPTSGDLGAAVHIEDFYDSFGTTMNSKLSGRYGFTDIFAVHAPPSAAGSAPSGVAGRRVPATGRVHQLLARHDRRDRSVHAHRRLLRQDAAEPPK